MAVDQMLSGAIAISCLAVALFFLRFWRTTHDRLFLYFALSFALEGINRVAIGLMVPIMEDHPLFYSLRIVAYGLIVAAIWRKNRTGR